jgi:hypothetical protein
MPARDIHTHAPRRVKVNTTDKDPYTVLGFPSSRGDIALKEAGRCGVTKVSAATRRSCSRAVRCTTVIGTRPPRGKRGRRCALASLLW